VTGLEGAGEVQTPLTGHPAALLAIGDLVWFRHAKAGELFEHTNTVQLLSGTRFTEEVATYRGHGLAF
jgi:D-serine deaminase-like pyridoxal phosphate-dependent protein